MDSALNDVKVLQSTANTLPLGAGRAELQGARGPRVRSAFSLVELLVVIAVIAILIGILVPVLNSARNSARAASTKTLMADMSSAVAKFQIDTRRQPGYFSQKDMGAATNVTDNLGFTNTENIILDLAGGISSATGETGSSDVSVSPAAGGPTVIEVGPKKNSGVFVDITRIGSSTQTSSGSASASYLKPDPKFFKAQSQTNQRLGLENVLPSASPRRSYAMPTIVDAFGQPILTWLRDETAGSNSEFGASDSSTKAQFYWGSNAGFFLARSLGKKGEDQTDDSILARAKASPADAAATMAGLLGNPSFPKPSKTPDAPAQARGPIVFHSAGVGGEYLSRESRGGKRAASRAGQTTDMLTKLIYKPNDDLLTDGSFEDILVVAGN